MKRLFAIPGVLIAAAILLPLPLAAQQLTCPSTAGVSAADCSLVHYHAQLFKLSVTRHYEVYGLNRFSSIEACEAERTLEEQENQVLVASLKRLHPKTKIQPNRYGPCHCDMTGDGSNPYFLDADKRNAQIRLFEVIRRETRSELMDRGLSSDSREVQSLGAKTSNFRSSLWPRFVPPPDAGDDHLLDNSTKLRDTKAATRTAVRATISSEIQLAEVRFSGEKLELMSPDEVSNLVPATTGSAYKVGEAFITRETERVQRILADSGSLSDSSVRKSVFEALMQRLQTLSNLRKIVEVGGTRSNLAAAIEAASSDESQVLSLIESLFGTLVRDHWTPETPGGAAYSIEGEIANDPVAVLRDSTGRFDAEARRTALYLVMASNASLTSSEELWLAEIIDQALEQE